jgi:ribosome maturation factor RimP
LIEGTKSPLFFNGFEQMQLRESIGEIVQKHIDDEFFIVDILIAGAGGRQKITVLLDGDSGITIDKCAEISRVLGEEIEKRDLISQNYILEVSSPGIDHPLKYNRQYKRNIGRKLKVQLVDDQTYSGTLKDVKDDCIIVEAEVQATDNTGKVLKNKKAILDTEIPFDKIKKTNVIISFS